MKEYILNTKALVMVQGSSKGAQPKYFDGQYWYKANSEGYEGLSEYLVSLILQYSNVEDYVTYEQCLINGKKGCRSRSFLNAEESFISFERLYTIYRSGHLLDAVRVIPEVKDRISYVVGFVKDTVGVDCSKYLSQILALDMLTLNIDRHFNNLGVVIDNLTGECRPAPIFDNGASLLSSWGKFNEGTLKENIALAYGQPFCANLKMQALTAGIGLALDYKKLEKRLSREPDSRALQVLKYQLQDVRELIPDSPWESLKKDSQYGEREIEI